MKSALKACLLAFAIACFASAQDGPKPQVRLGVPVEMAVASHAVETPAADKEDATVVTITAEGKVFVDIKPADVTALSRLSPGAVYVKADARAPYQNVLTVLDALRGRAVVLLAAPTEKVASDQIAPPYGVQISVGAR